MKTNNLIYYALYLSLLILMLYSCKKDGEDIIYPSFGELSLNVTMAANANKLLVQIDGNTRDTVKASSKPKTLRIETGKRTIQIIDQAGLKLLDTVLNFALKKPIKLSAIYTGTAMLLEDTDLTRKPSRDSLLVRFVTTDNALPDVMNIELSILYYDANNNTITVPTSKRVNGLTKDKFSGYIQLPNPSQFVPADAITPYYGIEGYDATANGANRKVMSIQNNTNGGIIYRPDDYNFEWVKNNILSMGIGPASQGNTFHEPIIIFQRIAE